MFVGPYLLWVEKTRISYGSETEQCVSETTAIAPSGMLDNNGAAVLISAVTFDSSPFPVAKLSLYSAFSSGENSASVWQMGKYDFFCDVCESITFE